jgi:GNAT superfamily N-acetyltransferase
MEPHHVIEYRRIAHGELTPELRTTLIDVHTDAFGPEMGDPFHQRFPWFVDHWSARPGFTCVIGYCEDKPIGFSYGAPSTPLKEWWREHWSPGESQETSTFSVSELMVLPDWRKTGQGLALHEQLLAGRPEALAVLLVDTSHPKVMDLYTSWGYRQVGESRPFADSPLYAVMVKQLR